MHVAVGAFAIFMPIVFAVLGLMVLPGRLLGDVPRGIVAGSALLTFALLIAMSNTDPGGESAKQHGGWLGGVIRGGLTDAAGTAGVRLLVAICVLAGVMLVTRMTFGGLAALAAAQVRNASDIIREARHDWSEEDEADETPDPTMAPARRSPSSRAATGTKTAGAAAAGSAFVDAEVDFADVLANQEDAPPDSLPVSLVDLPVDRPVPTDSSRHQDLAIVDPARDVTGDDDRTIDLSAAPVGTTTPYRLPDSTVLNRSRPISRSAGADERVAAALLEALGHHGVEARLVGAVSGPRVTRYEIQLAPGTKVSKVANLRDDLAYALATTEIRILAPIPGKQAVGVEVPNLSPNLVTLGDINGEFPPGSSPLSVWVGKDIAGNAVSCDLARMPHLLIAGTTGSGKSGCVNAMLTSILLHSSPEQVRMILIDPKRVELNHYEAIPHLLTPVVTNPKQAAAALLNCVTEMERRYERLGAVRARNISEFNRKRHEAGRELLPYILVVIDELADLMMVSAAEVEDAIIRLAQKSRAVGIHLVLATQRPSVDVITGMIKANVPSRIAFAVSSQTDSRVILDTGGAESLLGQGDMLYRPLGTSRLVRVQGAFVSEEEIALVVEQCRDQGEPDLDESMLDLPEYVRDEKADSRGEDELDPDSDPLLADAIRCVVNHETASVSLIQRRLRVGYTRAGRLVDMLERRGVISGYEGSKPRQVLITEADLPRLLDAL